MRPRGKQRRTRERPRRRLVFERHVRALEAAAVDPAQFWRGGAAPAGGQEAVVEGGVVGAQPAVGVADLGARRDRHARADRAALLAAAAAAAAARAGAGLRARVGGAAVDVVEQVVGRHQRRVAGAVEVAGGQLEVRQEGLVDGEVGRSEGARGRGANMRTKHGVYLPSRRRARAAPK
jgi:hypothetical protein